jgi:hypothetical protein
MLRYGQSQIGAAGGGQLPDFGSLSSSLLPLPHLVHPLPHIRHSTHTNPNLFYYLTMALHVPISCP